MQLRSDDKHELQERCVYGLDGQLDYRRRDVETGGLPGTASSSTQYEVVGAAAILFPMYTLEDKPRTFMKSHGRQPKVTKINDFRSVSPFSGNQYALVHHWLMHPSCGGAGKNI